MKKIIYILLVISIIPINIFALETNEKEVDLTPNATSSIMIEQTTGQVLYNKNANKPQAVASLTKMMGLILIFESIEKGGLKETEIITISENAKNMGGSQIWLETKEKISVRDLIKGVTMASANDAIVALAERVSGTEEAFVKKMNEKTKELGLKNTYFTNPTGLDEKGNYSSAYDMAIIAKELIKHEKVLEYTKKYDSYIREKTDNKTWITNTNKLVKFYEGTDGLKTGMTDAAGSCMAVTTKKGDLRLIVITLGFKDSKTRNKQTMDLLDYGFNQYEAKTIYKKNTSVGKVKIEKGTKEQTNLILQNDVINIKKKIDQERNYDYDIKIEKISYPIKKGDKLGTLYVKDNNKIISETNLISNENIDKTGIIRLFLKNLKNILIGN